MHCHGYLAMKGEQKRTFHTIGGHVLTSMAGPNRPVTMNNEGSAIRHGTSSGTNIVRTRPIYHASSNKSPHQRVIDTENGKEVHSNNPVLHMMVSYKVDFCHLKERSDEKSL